MQPVSSQPAAAPAAPRAHPPVLGIIGGGQLAKMTAQAAAQLGCETVILERQPVFPAASLAARRVLGDWDQPEALLELAALSDAVTLENEFVNPRALAALEQAGHPLWPAAATMRLIQDKLIQKQTLAQAGIATAKSAPADSLDELRRIAADWGLPLLLKARHYSYDGKGNAAIQTEADLEPAWNHLGGPSGRGLYAEEFCPFTHELAAIVTRGIQGEPAVYPVVETVQREHVCHLVLAPARVDPGTAARAAELARQAAEAVGAVGSFGVEMFLMADDRILVNELAPRVHNSGHYTIEACQCSQFENHVRAVLGWPLGSPAMSVPAAVMANLLAGGPGPGTPFGLAEALAVPGARIHIYGKSGAQKGRKMGHVTATAATLDQALATAQRAADLIHFHTTQ